MAFARTIVEDGTAAQTITEAINAYPRLGAAWEGWKWRLARDPGRDASKLPGGNPQRFILKTLTLPSVPSLTIHYSFDENEVRIISLLVGKYPTN